MTLNSLLDNTGAKFPLNVALIFETKSYTYAGLSRLTQCLAASLLQRGIGPGDRVAFLLPNCLEIVLCYYACFKIGAIAVPLNIRFQPELLKYCLTHSGARVLISEPELFDRIEEIRSSLPGVEQYYLTSSYTTYARPFSELLEAKFDSAGLPDLDQNCAAAIYYTSGTTGLPKAVIHSHASLTRATQIQINYVPDMLFDRVRLSDPAVSQ
jgi:acyl-CoA synthetase (AMP-forming)/AMP-acid ligase II